MSIQTLESFTLEELKYASEICFPDTFYKLLKKHLPEEDKDLALVYSADFKRIQGGGRLLTFIFKYSRADKEMYNLFNKILTDLLKGFKDGK